MKVKVRRHIKQEVHTERVMETTCCKMMTERNVAPVQWNYCAYCGEPIEYINGDDIIETVEFPN